ncbi:MAG: D-alanyl-D-alanine carboxypeptidase [Firmicutes bacterium]|nr:D-alanyl-D-alanine carboxypeptidase [Bacillota bacterium]
MKKRYINKLLIMITVIALVFSMGGLGSVYGLSLTSSEIPGVTDIENKGAAPEMSASAAFLMDASTGQVLYEMNAHEKNYPASTTKIMTALLAIENLNMEDVVSVDAEAAAVTGSRIFLSEGEMLSVKDLVYSLMVASANDSAIVLGKTMAGTIEEFAALMNEKARVCGALNTHFTNANGLPDEQHYTTAYDLAMITKAAFGHSAFREIVATPYYVVPATNLKGERELMNGNRMMWKKDEMTTPGGVTYIPYYEGTNGVKTGFTEAAGSCLVSSVSRDGHELIGVIMGCDRELHFQDMAKLMDYGFSNYDNVVLCGSDEYQYEVKVKKSETKRLNAGLPGDISITLPAGTDTEKVTTKVELEKKYEAPIENGQILGKVSVYYDGQLLCTENIVAMGEAAYKEGPDIGGIALIIGKIALVLIVILAVAYGIFAAVVNRMYKKKKEQRRRNRNQ